ncbi:MAG: component of SufBCD complex [Rhodobacteraceae bacterium]|nr:component of SufBCD complex [Paracoccaceae bacterium]
MNLTRLLFDLIDFRSFSNLWYWIALAVTWSTASHWVLGVPFDMVMRARRVGGAAMADLEDITRVNITRILLITHEAGLILTAVGFCLLTMMALLGFVYRIEFCQATFLIAFPMTIVGFLTVAAAHRINADQLAGEDLCRRLNRHRILIQAIGVVAITVTAMWGMLQNFNLSPLN